VNRILHGLTTQHLGRSVTWLPTVDSTNEYIKRKATVLPHGAICVANTQEHGRGRRGRVWETPPGQTLALSVLFKPCADVDCLPLACGLAVTRALTALCGRQFSIKWPNDSICNGAKVCGILCESVIVGTERFAVAGIGVNLTQTAADLARAGLPHAASLAMLTGMAPTPEAVATTVLNQLEPLWQQISSRGFAAIRADYSQHCITLHQSVRVLDADGRLRYEGVADGLTEDGCLLVRTAEEMHVVRAGEVSVRGLAGYV